MLLALATLVLLPGLLVVRAPWTAVPALSLAFWALSAWWPPLASAPRGRVALGVLVVFVPLLVLRVLPKHEVPPPPGTPPRVLPPPRTRRLATPALRSGPSLVVAAAALAVALPGLAWPNAPGALGAFHTTAARVVLWRDGIPASLEPLLTLEPFGAHAPALATLAADLARLSGGDPAPAVALVLAAAAATALLGLFALHAAWAPPRAAALGALLGLAILPWPAWLAAWGAPDAVLALAFLLPAVALATAHASRSSAVAAGFLLAAGALAQPAMAAGALASVVLVARLVMPLRPAARRAALVAAIALAFGLPGLWPLLRALSWREATAVGCALRPGEAAWCAAGLLALALGALAARPLALAGGRVAAAAALVTTALLVARVHGWMAAGELPLAARDALRRAALATAPLQPLCAPGPPLVDWVPAIAARPAGEPGPWVPPVYRDEWDARPRRPCEPFPR